VPDSYTNDTNAIKQYAPQYKDQVYAITVGSETMYRGNFTGDELLQKIQEVKAAVPGFKVGTADSWNKFQDGTADPLIKGGVDILLCNGFSYWQGQAIGNATKSVFDDMMQSFGHIQSVSGSLDKPELWVGETGMLTTSLPLIISY
jgi:glucan 1,3-beta-glucosidase